MKKQTKDKKYWVKALGSDDGSIRAEACRELRKIYQGGGK